MKEKIVTLLFSISLFASSYVVASQNMTYDKEYVSSNEKQPNKNTDIRSNYSNNKIFRNQKDKLVSDPISEHKSESVDSKVLAGDDDERLITDKLLTETTQKIVQREDMIEGNVKDLQDELSDIKNRIIELQAEINKLQEEK